MKTFLFAAAAFSLIASFGSSPAAACAYGSCGGVQIAPGDHVRQAHDWHVGDGVGVALVDTIHCRQAARSGLGAYANKPYGEPDRKVVECNCHLTNSEK